MSLLSEMIWEGIQGRGFLPKISHSTLYKSWFTRKDGKTCMPCLAERGKIYLLEEIVAWEPPLHVNCRCIIGKLETIQAGTAGIHGFFFQVMA